MNDKQVAIIRRVTEELAGKSVQELKSYMAAHNMTFSGLRCYSRKPAAIVEAIAYHTAQQETHGDAWR